LVQTNSLIKNNGSATNVHFYSLGAFVYPLIPLPRCRRHISSIQKKLHTKFIDNQELELRF
jgi:hypothetical protein